MKVKVKICGLTNMADAWAAIEAGADMLGFIFAPESPRRVSPVEARGIVRSLGPRAAVLTVGVFVNESAERVAEVLDFCGLNVAQLHGEEAPDVIAADVLRGRAFKALRLSSIEQAETLVARYVRPEWARSGGRLPAFLLDAVDIQRRGGTGRSVDVALAAYLAARYPLLLAGGLNPENVAERICQVGPWGVDVAGGVEASPGQKDRMKLSAFVEAVRKAEAELERMERTGAWKR